MGKVRQIGNEKPLFCFMNIDLCSTKSKIRQLRYIIPKNHLAGGKSGMDFLEKFEFSDRH